MPIGDKVFILDFTKPIFFIFFGVVFTIHCLLRKNPAIQLSSLLVASLLFYAWFEPRDVLLILVVTLLSYFFGHQIAMAKGGLRRKVYMITAVLTLLTPLLYYKYLPLLLLSWAQYPNLDQIRMVDLKQYLPLGISFYTFEALAYVIDVYRRDASRCNSLRSFFLYIAFFPHLIAGPIVRAQDFLSQFPKGVLVHSRHQGAFLVLYGLMKKLLVADLIGVRFVDPAFKDATLFSGTELWLVAYLYAFQIFLDFSAYSDIAIGLGRLFGIELPKNFDAPYQAHNPSDFWKRWHISLSTWFRDYVYVPLGGNRSPWAPVRIATVVLTMLLCGFWHGANWTFLAWGAWHAALLLFYRGLAKFANVPFRIPHWAQQIIFFHLVSFGWVFFRSETLSGAFQMMAKLLSPSSLDPLVFVSNLLVIVTIGWVLNSVENRRESWGDRFQQTPVWIQSLVWIGFFIFVRNLETSDADRAFIYFQF